MQGGSWGTQKPPVGSQVNWGHPLSSSMTACYLVNEQVGGYVRDLVYGAIGTLTNFIYSSTSGWTPSPVGTALKFDGANDYVQVPNSTRYRPTGAMTYSIRLVGACTAGVDAGMGSLGASGSRGPALGVDNANNVHFYIATNSTTLVSVTGSHASTTTWYRYTAVYIPSVSITIYRNGIQLAQNTTSIPSSQYQGNGLGLQLGSRGDDVALSSFLSGSIADAFIWNRALTPTEVLQHAMQPYAMIAPPAPTKFYSYAAPTSAGPLPPRVIQAGVDWLKYAD